MITVTDNLMIDASGLSFTRDGYLVGEAKIARAGNVQSYAGRELGLTGSDANRMFGVYRDPDAVFDRDSMLSLAGRPVTRDHPESGVDARNWRDLAIGQVGGVIRKDGEHVVAPMAIMDARAAQEVANGARSLSAGYTCNIVADAGVAPDGTPYQYRQTGPIRFNHVAYLPDNNPRAGNTRIGDDFNAADKGKPGDGERTPPIEGSNTMNLRKIVIDGLTIETTDAGAEVIAKLNAQIADGKAAIDKAAKDAAEVKTAHDKALADKDKEITDLKAKIPTVDQLEEMFDRRAAVIDAAKKLAPDLDPKGKSLADVRKAVVAKRLGDGAVKDRSDDYIAAQFDALATLAKDGAADPDPVRDALKGGVTTTANDADKARQKYLEDQAKAWAA